MITPEFAQVIGHLCFDRSPVIGLQLDGNGLEIVIVRGSHGRSIRTRGSWKRLPVFCEQLVGDHHYLRGRCTRCGIVRS